jgi:hypothetical protein
MPKMDEKKSGGNKKVMPEPYTIDSGYQGSGTSGRTAKDGESQSGSETKTLPKEKAGKPRMSLDDEEENM